MAKAKRPRVQKDWDRAVTIRLSQDDYDTLDERSREQGMSHSSYLRFLIRRARIRVTVEA